MDVSDNLLNDRYDNIMNIIGRLTESNDSIDINDILIDYIELIYRDKYFMNLFTKYKYNIKTKSFEMKIDKHDILFKLLQEYRKLKNVSNPDKPKSCTSNSEVIKQVKRKKQSKISNTEDRFGLKTISKMILMIINKLNECEFKELSKIIITRCSQDKPLSNNDEYNMERKIYTSLNVLCTLEMIKKKGNNFKLIKNNKVGSKHTSYNELNTLKVITSNIGNKTTNNRIKETILRNNKTINR
jgi:hypothetical protein